MVKHAELIEFGAHSVTKYSRPSKAPSESLNLIRVMTYSDFLISYDALTIFLVLLYLREMTYALWK